MSAPSRIVLRLVQELHLRGYQRVRIAPGLAPSGMHWRCTITHAGNISAPHGARVISSSQACAHYSSASEADYFGWTDARGLAPGRLAERFLARFPAIAAAGRGSDWPYVGWYVEMLHLTYPGALPIAYADRDMPDDHLPTIGEGAVRVPMPPPGDPGRP